MDPSSPGAVTSVGAHAAECSIGSPIEPGPFHQAPSSTSLLRNNTIAIASIVLA